VRGGRGRPGRRGEEAGGEATGGTGRGGGEMQGGRGGRRRAPGRGVCAAAARLGRTARWLARCGGGCRRGA
jgi:hypothetical protein